MTFVPVMVGGVVVSVIAWLLMGRRRRAKAPIFASEPGADDVIIRPDPADPSRLIVEDAPPLPLVEAGAVLAGNVVAAGIQWGARRYKDGGAWRAHVRPIFGPALVEGRADSIVSLARMEGESARRLDALNRVHKAFTFENAIATLADAVELEGAPTVV
jgi:hypothetical protein